MIVIRHNTECMEKIIPSSLIEVENGKKKFPNDKVTENRAMLERRAGEKNDVRFGALNTQAGHKEKTGYLSRQ